MVYMWCMCGKMPDNGYVSVSVPNRLHKVLSEIVEDEDSLYTSVSELVKEALREKIITLRSQT